MNIAYICSFFLILLSIYIVRLIKILNFFKVYDRISQPSVFNSPQLANNKNKNDKLNVFVFLGSGGHTGELLRILQNYNEVLLCSNNILYVGYSDIDSYNKFKKLIKPFKCKVEYYQFIKAREVGAGKWESTKSILKTLAKSIGYVIKIRYSMCNSPHLVLFNGPGTCCILALWFKLIEWLIPFLSCSNIIYIESLARVDTLSLTGKILYWLADEFIVQWEELQKTVVPRAKYFGILV